MTSGPTRPDRSVAARLAVSIAALAAATIGGVARAAPVATPPASTLALVAQTPWVTPGGVFDLRVRLVPAPPTPGGRLSVTVYGAVPNRTEFARTVAGNTRDFGVIAHPLSGQSLGAITQTSDGALDVPIATQDPTQPRDFSRLALSRTGVYPVRVELDPERGGSPTSVVTHLLYLAGPVGGPRLLVSWLVPFSAPPTAGPEGVATVSAEQSDRFAVLASTLERAHLPVVLRPSPDTLAALSTADRPRDKTTVATLARLAIDDQLLTGPYVPLQLPALLAAGMEGDVVAQVTRGHDTVAAALGIRPDGRSWVVDGPLDAASVAFLRGAQVDRLVVPDADLSNNPLPVTLAQPFTLATPGAAIDAVSSDPGLTAHFGAADPVLGAHQLLADLMSLWLDRPGQSRGVVLDTPPGWGADPGFVSALVDGLTSSPMLQAATLDTLFATVPPATVARGQRLSRTLVPDPAIIREVAAIPAAELRAERARLNAFASALTPDNPLPARLEAVLLTAESSAFADLKARQAELGLFRRLLDGQLALVQLPSGRKITLTARTGQLPITVLSGADYPMRVVVRLSSDKLSFGTPGGTGAATTTLDLHRGNNPLQLSVRARTAGSFPLRISVVSPQGGLVLTATTFTVQSTALSGVGVLLSAGAALFLGVWWFRQILRNRRRRRSPETPPGPASRRPRPAADARPAVPVAARLTRVPDPAGRRRPPPR